MGISNAMVKGRGSTLDKTGKSIPFDCPNTGDPHVLSGLRIRNTELYDLSFLQFWHGRLFFLEF
jgi:hypothetical protein